MKDDMNDRRRKMEEGRKKIGVTKTKKKERRKYREKNRGEPRQKTIKKK